MEPPSSGFPVDDRLTEHPGNETNSTAQETTEAKGEQEKYQETPCEEMPSVNVPQTDNKSPSAQLRAKVIYIPNQTSTSTVEPTVCLGYICAVCGYVSDNRHQMFRHMRTHTGEKPYRCNKCDFSTAWAQSLEQHMRKHTGEKPYMCEECGYRAARKVHLEEHMTKHTGNKPHKCDQCDYASVRKAQLVEHKRRHTGEKPYMCEKCGYMSTQSAGLRQHMRTHTREKPFKCDQCDYAAGKKQSLEQHRISQHPDWNLTSNVPSVCED